MTLLPETCRGNLHAASASGVDFKDSYVLLSTKFRLHGLELIQVQAFAIKKKLKICSCEVTYVLQFFKASSKSLLGGYFFRLAPTKSFYLYFLTLSGVHFPAWNADRRYKEQPA